MTLVEVLVAMFIFALVSTGLVYTMLAVTSLGRDSRSRQVAANLASEALDRAREEADIFALLDGTYDREINGDTFHVTRSTAWVSDPAADFDCGGGGGAGAPLRYKRVNIEVTWDNMREGSSPVHADTIIDPKNRINDPTKGTILVNVINGEGLGNQGVSVSAQPVTAGGSPVGAALPSVSTDAEGCAYVLRVDPGHYKVTISKANHRDVANVAAPFQQTEVVADATTSLAFSYDIMTTFRLTYAEDFDPPASVANAMPTTFVSTYGNVLGAGSGNPRQFTLFPFASGYDVLPGRFKPVVPDPNDPSGPPISPGCLSPDPAAWAGGTRFDTVAGEPGATVDAPVRMGVVEVNVGPIADPTRRFVRVVSVATPPAGTADPGCAEGYSFTYTTAPLDAAGHAVLALPFGTWELYRGSTAAPTTRITDVQMVPLTMGSVQGGSAGTVTLDPRMP